MDNTLDVLIKGVQKMIDNSGFDKTYRGYISAISNNLYTVVIGGSTYTSVPAVSGLTLSVGNTVFVKIPCNNWTQMYIENKIS